MRLAVIGPGEGEPAALRTRLELALKELASDRVVYLGVDSEMTQVVEAWAREIVDGDPSDDAVWARAVRSCCFASAYEIDGFIRAERARSQLRKVSLLPHAEARTVEIFDSAVAILIHDKGLLDEEDMLPATLLIFGKSPKPLMHQVGSRTFISPGPANHPEGGLVVLEEREEGVIATIHGGSRQQRHRALVAPRARGTRMMVKGSV